MSNEFPDPDQITDVPKPTLADTDDSQEDRGRIGYGRNERTSSWLLGVVLILLVVGIGAYQWINSRSDTNISSRSSSIDSPIVGAQAPDFTMPTFDGDEITLSEQHGKVVILNFWGSWCEPCKREMPAFQAYWESAPDDVVMIGVGAKQDTDEQSRAFAEQFTITYPIGRDAEGDRVTTGQIAQDYSITFYPMTFIINPDSVISALVIGEMNEDDLNTYVQKARDEVSSGISIPLAMDTRKRG